MRGRAAIEQDIRSALELDSRVPHPQVIAVSVDEIGTVILRGTVADLRQRHAAVVDARAVDGVFDVLDKLAISLRERGRRADYELRGRALQALIDADGVPSDRVDVEVSDGRVTLVGEVDCQFQSHVAEEAVAHLAGIDAVSNQLRVAVPG
ncbi:MAG: BON domain-containing protein [Solirubrobacterales bacterium]|nr:BON domain-containing protein [Solirubrobacterales bacterium]